MTVRFSALTSMLRRWRLTPAALACLACGDAPTVNVPAGPAVSVVRVGYQDLPCTDPCGVKLTYETRLKDAGTAVAAKLRLSGDGMYPRSVSTTLPDGRVTFFWEFPRPRVSGTRYELALCPEVGSCASITATIYLPEAA